MKTCPHCSLDFEIGSKGSGGKNRVFCFKCFPKGLTRKDRKVLSRNLWRVIRNRDKLDKGCLKCGYSKNPAALEWHHPNDDKDFNISESARSLHIIEEEIGKCELLCANCHREHHFPMFNH